MTFRRATLCQALSVLFSCGLVTGSAAEPEGNRYALLIGCTRYDNIPQYQLQGPANDVVLFRDILMTRFGFSRESITTLAEGAGDELRPTRANIERECQRLARAAKRGDRVVVLLGGHGCQQPGPDPDHPQDPSAWTMHKIFLPADVQNKVWDEKKRTLVNAISDDDFHRWLADIRKSGADLWIIVDACHSGGMIRGMSDEVTRQVPAEVLVPPAILAKVHGQSRTVAEQNRGDNEEDPGLGARSEDDSMVVMYAAQASEPTPEKSLPPDSPDGKRRGLFTYTICEVLARSSIRLTYNELVQRVQAQYREWGRIFPTPLVQGRDRDREVLGTTRWLGRSHIWLSQDSDGNGWKINAGALHGLTQGSVLAVYPPAGTARPQTPLCYVRAGQPGTLETHVEPCEYKGLAPHSDRLAAAMVCEPVMIDYGDLRLRVAVDRLDNHGARSPEGDLQASVTLLRRLAQRDNSLVAFVERDLQADWLIRCNGGKLYLVPASGARAASGGELPVLYGPAPDGDVKLDWLDRRLTQIARVHNLERLSSSPDGIVQSDDKVKVDLKMCRLESTADHKGTPLVFNGRELEVHDGDLVQYTLHNPNSFPVDVTLLYIDSDYGITAFFPKPNLTSRLMSGETSRPFRICINAKTVGLERFLLIAVHSNEVTTVEFTGLAQPTLEAAKAMERTRGEDPFGSPLGHLLAQAFFAVDGQRGASETQDLTDYRIETLGWHVLPRQNPKQGRETAATPGTHGKPMHKQ